MTLEWESTAQRRIGPRPGFRRRRGRRRRGQRRGQLIRGQHQRRILVDLIEMRFAPVTGQGQQRCCGGLIILGSTHPAVFPAQDQDRGQPRRGHFHSRIRRSDRSRRPQIDLIVVNGFGRRIVDTNSNLTALINHNIQLHIRINYYYSYHWKIVAKK